MDAAARLGCAYAGRLGQQSVKRRRALAGVAGSPCEGAWHAECRDAALSVVAGSPSEVHFRTYDLTVGLVEKACLEGDLGACVAVLASFEDEGHRAGQSGAARWAAAACGLGEAEACALTGP